MKKGAYIDGFVLPVPKKNTAKYVKMALDAKKVWLQFGALDYKECMLDDLNPGKAKLTFPKMAGVKAGETVWYSFVTYKSRTHRDSVNKKVMAYFMKKYGKDAEKDMPFDMTRMAYAGFKVMVGA